MIQLLQADALKPTIHTAQYDLYLGDCLEVLPQLDCKVDAVITDPPYNVGIRYGDYSDRIDNYLEWATKWISQCRKLSPMTIFTMASTKIHEIPKPDWLGVWYKPFTAGWWNTPLIPHWEAIAFYGLGKYFRSDVFKYIPCRKDKKIDHPTPKPVSLFLDFISTFTKVNDIVLDPFAGSGTTGVACMQLGRRFIGVEIVPKYFDIAERRIREAAMQIRMEI